MKTKILIISFIFVIVSVSYSQVKIGGNGQPVSGAMMELEGSNGGFVPPRINLTSNTMQINGNTPADGMMVYSINTTIGTGLFVWHSAKWNSLKTASPITLTYGKFKGQNSSGINYALKWDSVFTKSPGGALWSAQDPTRIYVWRQGLYLISASFRMEGHTNAQSQEIALAINDVRNGGANFFTGSTGATTSTYTSVVWLNDHDSIQVWFIDPDKIPNVSLGTTQLTITEIPLNSN